VEGLLNGWFAGRGEAGICLICVVCTIEAVGYSISLPGIVMWGLRVLGMTTAQSKAMRCCVSCCRMFCCG
jgi:hypothetical protein